MISWADVLLCGGTLAATVGVWAYDWRAGLIIGGVLALSFGLILAIGGGGNAGNRDT